MFFYFNIFFWLQGLNNSLDDIIQIYQAMTSKGNKYALLDKNQQYNESDMIEMVQINNFHGGNTEGKSEKTDIDYVRLDDESIAQNQKTKKPPQPQKSSQPQSQPQSQYKQPASRQPRRQQQQGQNPCTYPTYSVNPQPTNINMNGSNYRLQNSPQVQKTSKVPEMKVGCNFCTFQQSVPGNTQVFVCCCCNNMNECFPLYGLFICGSCQGKVCYPYGTSEMIRCTRCGTINKVPSEPMKSYIKDLPKKQQVPEPKKEQKKQFKFVEQQDFQEVAWQPERPKKQKQGEQQQIFFQDVPSKKENNNTYPDII